METTFESPAPEFFADFDRLRSHHTELVKNYADQWVAAADGEIVASGRNLAEVERRASERCRGREVPVMFIEPGRHLLTRFRLEADYRTREAALRE